MENMPSAYMPIKKKASAGVITFIIVAVAVVTACAVLGALYFDALSYQPFGDKANTSVITSTIIETDSNGLNLVGTTPERMSGGGMFATQGEWTFYADTAKGGDGCLYASKDGKTAIKLTDFAVANINVAGDQIVFTDLSGTALETFADNCSVTSYLESDVTSSFDSVYEAAETSGTPVRLVYGGRLYKMTGVADFMQSQDKASLSEAYTVEYSGDRLYSNVFLNGERIYAVSRVENPSGNEHDFEFCIITPNEYIDKIYSSQETDFITSFVLNGILYLECDYNNDEKIDKFLCYDIENSEMIGEIPAENICAYGDRIFFISVEDRYVYQIIVGETEATRISAVPVECMSILENGDLEITFGNYAFNGLISLNDNYNMALWRQKVQVGEWWNYLEGRSYFVVGLHRPKAPKAKKDEKKPKPPEGVNIIQKKEKISTVNAVEMLLYLTRDGELSNPLFDVYDEQQKDAFYSLYGYEAGMGFAEYMKNVIISGKLKDGSTIIASEGDTAKIVDMMFGFFNECEYTIGNSEKQSDGTYLVPVHVTRTFDIDYFINSMEEITGNKEKIADLVYPYMDAHGYTMSDVARMSEQELVDFSFDIVYDYIQTSIIPNCMMDCDVTFNAIVVEDPTVYYKVQNYDDVLLMVYLGKTDGFDY